jgi:hypothetical protein
MKVNFKTLFVVVLMLVASLPLAVAQTGVTSTELDADTVLQAAIVSRLQHSASTITIDAPNELLLRALPKADAETSGAVDDETSSDQDQERVARSKGGKAVGYRVQVYADNNVRTAKAEARQRERVMNQAFPTYATYVAYASPYWRLRVGDFRSQYEAEKAAAEIRKAFPRYAKEVRVVRDRVNSH